jgi:hypothetical protein
MFTAIYISGMGNVMIELSSVGPLLNKPPRPGSVRAGGNPALAGLHGGYVVTFCVPAGIQSSSEAFYINNHMSLPKPPSITVFAFSSAESL